jgi:hypothetical protein
MCFSGWIIHWKRNLLGKFVEQNEAKTVDYITRKQAGVVREVITDYFAEKGIDVKDLVAARQKDIARIRDGFTLA